MLTLLWGCWNAFRFGPYEADVRAGELRKDGLRIQLRDKSFEVLVCLLEHPGELVTREELRRRLWPSGVFVEFDNSLNSSVSSPNATLRTPQTEKYAHAYPRECHRNRSVPSHRLCYEEEHPESSPQKRKRASPSIHGVLSEGRT